jgi:hypothetical protein
LQTRHHGGPRPILSMSVNSVSILFSCAFWIIYVLFRYRHPFLRYWLSLMTETTATGCLPRPENDHERNVSNGWLHMIGDLCSDWLQASIYQMLAACTGKNNSGILAAGSSK